MRALVPLRAVPLALVLHPGHHGGTGIHRTAIAWLALDAGPFAVGLVLAAGMVPNLLFGLAGGTLADRVRRKRLIASVSLATIPIMLACRPSATANTHPSPD